MRTWYNLTTTLLAVAAITLYNLPAIAQTSTRSITANEVLNISEVRVAQQVEESGIR